MNSTPNRLMIGAAVFALIALGVSGYLSVQTLFGNPVAGCGGDSGCGAVLASPWAKVGSLPVSLLGAATYLAVLLGLALRYTSQARNKLADFVLLAAAPAMLIAAGWFTYIQHFELQEYCPYCMIDHGIGVVLAFLLPVIVLGNAALKPALPLAVGVLGVGGLIAVQHLAPTIDDAQGADNPFVDRDGDKVIDSKRHISVFGGELQFVLQDVPSYGGEQADQVVVLMFDYACPHCRSMHELMDEALKAKPGSFALVPLPVSIRPDVNPHLNDDNERFKDSYELAVLAQAVAAVDRGKWAAFDDWLFSPDTITTFPRRIEEAEAKAAELIGQAALDAQLTGEALAKHKAVIDRNIELLALIPEADRRIPVTTAPGVSKHRTEKFYDLSEVDKLLAAAAAGLKAVEAAAGTPKSN